MTSEQSQKPFDDMEATPGMRMARWIQKYHAMVAVTPEGCDLVNLSGVYINDQQINLMGKKP